MPPEQTGAGPLGPSTCNYVSARARTRTCARGDGNQENGPNGPGESEQRLQAQGRGTQEPERWLQGVLDWQAKDDRQKALREELRICREQGKRIRHADRLRRIAAGDTNREESSS